MSIGVDLGRCLGESTWVDVEQSQSELMSSRVGLGKCRLELALADVELSRHEPMSSLVGPGPSRPMLAQADFLSQLGSLSSGVGPKHCRPKST